MVLEPVCCPDCGSEDVVKNGKSAKASNGIYVAIEIAIVAVLFGTTPTEDIYLPSNNRLQIWQLTAAEFGTQRGY